MRMNSETGQSCLHETEIVLNTDESSQTRVRKDGSRCEQDKPQGQKMERSWNAVIIRFWAVETRICIAGQNPQEKETPEKSVRSGKEERPPPPKKQPNKSINSE